MNVYTYVFLINSSETIITISNQHCLGCAYILFVMYYVAAIYLSLSCLFNELYVIPFSIYNQFSLTNIFDVFFPFCHLFFPLSYNEIFQRKVERTLQQNPYTYPVNFIISILPCLHHIKIHESFHSISNPPYF